MPYSFVQRDTGVYLLCNHCGAQITKDPRTGEWGAYDDPGRRGMSIEGTESERYALCVSCYGKAFRKKYPGEPTPRLYDGRVAIPAKEERKRIALIRQELAEGIHRAAWLRQGRR